MGKQSVSQFCKVHRTKVAMGSILGFTVVFFSILAIGITSSRSSKELQMVHVIMRHGIRTPASTYPKDPYINDTFYPTGWGQITNPGKMDLFKIGQFLRKRYDTFLGTFYSPDLYYTQATDVDRTKVSMQLVNAGLWPPNDDQKWGPLNWQPIPVHSEPLAQDNLLLVRRPCAQYHLELEKVMQSEEIQSKLESYKETFGEITELSGQVLKNFDDAQDIYSTLLAEENLGLKLPQWTEKYYPKILLPPTILSYVVNAYNDKLNRLKGGVLLKKLISDWKSKVDNKSQRKAILYGGHDSTIVNIMSTLKVWDPQMPGYAITILLEFSKDLSTGKHGLEIFLRNSTTVPPYQLTIPGCDKFCPFDKLIELTTNVVPDNWEEECKSDDANYTVPPPGGP